MLSALFVPTTAHLSTKAGWKGAQSSAHGISPASLSTTAASVKGRPAHPCLLMSRG